MQTHWMPTRRIRFRARSHARQLTCHIPEIRKISFFPCKPATLDILCSAMSHPSRVLVCVLFLTTLHSALLHAQRGALTAPQSIDQLTREAAVIVRGYIT